MVDDSLVINSEVKHLSSDELTNTHTIYTLEPSPEHTSLTLPSVQSLTFPIEGIHYTLHAYYIEYTPLDESFASSSSPDNKYVGQVVYEVIKDHDNEWLMRFMVAKHLNVLLEVIII